MIFDVDGTLVDSNDAHARAWVDAFAEHGITVAYESVCRAIGMGGDKVMPLVAGLRRNRRKENRSPSAVRKSFSRSGSRGYGLSADTRIGSAG